MRLSGKGKYEPTNEMFYTEFGTYLDSLCPDQPGRLESVILPQVKKQVHLKHDATTRPA